MKGAFVFIVVCGAVLLGWISYGRHTPQLKSQPSSDQSQESESKTPTSQPIGPGIVAGPLAQWMQSQTPSQDPPEEHGLRKPHPSDHIAPSPVGTSSSIVHKTFAITSMVKFLLEIPPHAVSAQLRGRYRSFAQQAGVRANDESADVEFFVMNQQQYEDSLRGRPPEALFSVDASHDQEINFGFPASQDQPVKYYLVFRNNRSGEPRKIVQADFDVDF